MRLETVSRGLRISWAIVADKRPACARRSLVRRVSSVWRRCVMSRNTITTPTSWPRSFVMGAAVSSIGYSRCKRLMSIRSLESPTDRFATGAPVRGIIDIGAGFLVDNPHNFWQRPQCVRSRSSHPVSCCATGLMNETLPAESVATTASPMLFSVIWNDSRLSLSCCAFSASALRCCS